MIQDKQLLGKLKDFGLNSYESKLWTALLSRGISTAGELSDIAHVPRSRSYDVLESLERKGFIITKLGKPIKYIAVPPSEVLERVKKKIREEAESQAQVLEGLKGSEILSELNTLHKTGIDMVGPSDLTGTIKSRNNLHNHLEMIIRNASSSVVLCTTEPGFTRKIEALHPVLAQAKAKGVDVRIIAPTKGADEAVLAKAQEVASVKHSDKHMGRFCIADDKECLVMLVDDEKTHPNYDVGVWTSAPFFAESLGKMANVLWDNL